MYTLSQTLNGEFTFSSVNSTSNIGEAWATIYSTILGRDNAGQFSLVNFIGSWEMTRRFYAAGHTTYNFSSATINVTTDLNSEFGVWLEKPFIKIVGGIFTGSFSGNSSPVSSLWRPCMFFLKSAENASIDGLTITNCHVNGIFITDSSNNCVTISNCSLQSCKVRGIWALSANGVVVSNCNVQNCSLDGIDIDTNSNNCVIKDNTCESNGRHGIFVEEGANGITVINNKSNKNNCGVCVESNVVSKTRCVNVLQNSCENNDTGIFIDALPGKLTSNVSVRNNTFNNNSTGIAIRWNVKNVVCTKNTCNGNSRYGISISEEEKDTPKTLIKVSGNYCSNNALKNIYSPIISAS